MARETSTVAIHPQNGPHQAAPLHSCKYRWLRAPATTLADGFPVGLSICSRQHQAQIALWNHDPFDEAAQCLSGSALLVATLQRGHQLLDLRPVDVGHRWMQQRQRLVAGCQLRGQRGLPKRPVRPNHRHQPVVDDSGCVELLPLVNNWQQFDTSLVVCRGFSDAREGGPSSLDLGDDVVDGLGPHRRVSGRRSSVMPTRRSRLRPAQTQPEVRPGHLRRDSSRTR